MSLGVLKCERTTRLNGNVSTVALRRYMNCPPDGIMNYNSVCPILCAAELDITAFDVMTMRNVTLEPHQSHCALGGSVAYSRIGFH